MNGFSQKSSDEKYQEKFSKKIEINWLDFDNPINKKLSTFSRKAIKNPGDIIKAGNDSTVFIGMKDFFHVTVLQIEKSIVFDYCNDSGMAKMYYSEEAKINTYLSLFSIFCLASIASMLIFSIVTCFGKNENKNEKVGLALLTAAYAIFSIFNLFHYDFVGIFLVNLILSVIAAAAATTTILFTKNKKLLIIFSIIYYVVMAADIAITMFYKA